MSTICTLSCHKGHAPYRTNSFGNECPQCAVGEPPAFQVGDRVYWNDPDNGSGSGVGIITHINAADERETTDDTIISVDLDCGSEVEALPCELDLLRGEPITTVRLQLEVDYHLNGTPADELARDLERLGYHLSSNGLLSNGTDAEVDEWRVKATVIEPAHLVFSPSEARAGGGFWSNENGWGTMRLATPFTTGEAQLFHLPESRGGDAQWVLVRQNTLPGRDRADAFIEGARLHGEDSDPDHEVGDLQEFFRAAYGLLTPDQRIAFERSPEVIKVREAW